MECAHFGNAAQSSIPWVETGDSCAHEVIRNFACGELLNSLPKTARLISVDGLDGVGKSKVAAAIANLAGATLVELDAFLERHQNAYLEALDLGALEKTLSSSRIMVVEGCLMQAVLGKIGLKSDFSVYLVRTTKMYAEPDMESVDERDLLFSEKGAAELIRDEEEMCRRWAEIAPEFGGGGDELSGLTKELIAYHCEFAPHRRADLVVKLVRMT